jgi:hypothetical protein
MSNFRISIVPRAFLAPLLLTILIPGLVPSAVHAQQSEIPPAPADQSAVQEQQEPERIVEGRPRLYTVKRFLHPVSWLEGGVRPLLRVMGNMGEGDTSSEQKAAPEAGVKFSLRGLGGGSGFGPEVKPFHNNLFNRGIEVELPMMVTYKLYQSFGFRGNYPLVSGGAVKRIGLELTTGYTSRPSDNFFGIGNDTSQESQTRYRSVSRDVAVAIDARINDVWAARVETGYRSVGITSPRNFKSAMDEFRDEEIPGLLTGARFISTSASIQRNTKNDPRFPSAGGIQRIEASVNEGDDRSDFSYWRFRYDMQQFFSLSSDRRKVIALKVGLETNQEKGGSSVPFFDFPIIGSRGTVRGFESRRFADKSALNFSAEYRYRIWRHLDWALFVDQGQVAPEIGDFGLSRFHTGYGMRFVARPPGNRGVSIEVGRSNEAWRLYLNFSQDF